MFYEVYTKITLDISFSGIHKCPSSTVLASEVPVNVINTASGRYSLVTLSISSDPAELPESPPKNSLFKSFRVSKYILLLFTR